MKKNNILTIGQITIILLGLAMIYIGAFYGEKTMLPPIITGIGFFVIAWIWQSLKR